MTIQPTAAGRVPSEAERDYARIAYEAVASERYRTGGYVYAAWDDLRPFHQDVYRISSDAVRDAVLADVPHQRAADVVTAAVTFMGPFDPEREDAAHLSMSQRYAALQQAVERYLAAPTDPRLVDGDAAREE